MSPAGSLPPRTPRVSPWSLRRRLGRVFIAVALVLLALAIAVIASTVRFATRGSDIIFRWQPAAAASQRALADLVNQETGVRGYVLTRQSAALKPYEEYLRAQRKDEHDIERLIGSVAGISGKLRAFEASAESWQRTVASPLVAQVRAGGHPTTSTLDAGRAHFDRIRARSAELTAAINTRTSAERGARAHAQVYATIALALSVAVLALAGAGLWIGLRRWVLAPVESLGAQTRLVAEGDVRRRIDPNGPEELVGLGSDVEAMRARIATQLGQAEELLAAVQQKSAELERSNADLQQFAYVASHDLSEPLRKVANFCQLLERQYGPQLDDRARQYIDFAVDGAKRMQILITDLLSLSRVGRTTEHFVWVDLDKALDQTLITLAERIEDAHATVERASKLPTVAGDRTLLTSLLENLVGNAIKYRRGDVPPVVRISAEFDDEQQLWQFAVSDNGIGIDPQYAERIFVVFQRLHLRDQFGGTGIGLALCRRIVEFHRGQIWLDTVGSEGGATFRFTLPEGDVDAESAV